MDEPTVGAGFARGLFRFAVSRGAERRALELASGVRLADLEDQDRRLPFSAYVALMRAAKTLTGDPALALHYAENVDISEVSIIGLIGLASSTMYEGFVQLNRYVPLIVETQNLDGGDRFRLEVDHRGAWIVDARTNPNDFPELTESALAQLICGPRRHVPGFKVAQVHFTHPDPGCREEYERVLQAPVTFDSDRNGFQIDPSGVQIPVAKLPRYAFGVLTDRADALLEELESSRSVRAQVEKRLLPILHTGEVSMDAIASQMGLSRQTLFRKLKAEDTTFEKVLDELRHKMALHYLRGRKVSVNETAYLLGFSDPAPFSRAFKRWTGISPREARAA